MKKFVILLSTILTVLIYNCLNVSFCVTHKYMYLNSNSGVYKKIKKAVEDHISLNSDFKNSIVNYKEIEQTYYLVYNKDNVLESYFDLSKGVKVAVPIESTDPHDGPINYWLKVKVRFDNIGTNKISKINELIEHVNEISEENIKVEKLTSEDLCVSYTSDDTVEDIIDDVKNNKEYKDKLSSGQNDICSVYLSINDQKYVYGYLIENKDNKYFYYSKNNDVHSNMGRSFEGDTLYKLEEVITPYNNHLARSKKQRGSNYRIHRIRGY